MNIEIRDAALEARTQKQIQATGAASAGGGAAPASRDAGGARPLADRASGSHQCEDPARHRSARPRGGNPGGSTGRLHGEARRSASMRRRYVLAPEAALDLVNIWRYIKRKVAIEMADRVESAIRSRGPEGDTRRGDTRRGRPDVSLWRKPPTRGSAPTDWRFSPASQALFSRNAEKCTPRCSGTGLPRRLAGD